MFTASLLRDVFPDGKEMTLYGKGYGAKIQKGGTRYRGARSFVLFNVMVGPLWLIHDAVQGIAAQLHIDAVLTEFMGSGLNVQRCVGATE